LSEFDAEGGDWEEKAVGNNRICGEAVEGSWTEGDVEGDWDGDRTGMEGMAARSAVIVRAVGVRIVFSGDVCGLGG
jgi:hypothetical protein